MKSSKSTPKERDPDQSAREPGFDEPAPKSVTTKASPEQLRKFEEAARALGTDDDPERFKERVRGLVRAPQGRAIETDKS